MPAVAITCFVSRPPPRLTKLGARFTAMAEIRAHFLFARIRIGRHVSQRRAGPSRERPESAPPMMVRPVAETATAMMTRFPGCSDFRRQGVHPVARSHEFSQDLANQAHPRERQGLWSAPELQGHTLIALGCTEWQLNVTFAERRRNSARVVEPWRGRTVTDLGHHEGSVGG